MRMSTCDSGGSLASDMGPAAIPPFCYGQARKYLRTRKYLFNLKDAQIKYQKLERNYVPDMMMCDVHELLLLYL